MMESNPEEKGKDQVCFHPLLIYFFKGVPLYGNDEKSFSSFHHEGCASWFPIGENVNEK